MSNKQLREEKLSLLLARFAIPVILSMLVAELYAMVDTFFVGRNVGEAGIGSLMVVFPIQRLITALTIMVAVGTVTAFSRENGKNNYSKAAEYINSGLSILIAIIIPVIILIFSFKAKIVSGLGATGELAGMSIEYMGTIMSGALFLSLTIFIAQALVATGNVKASIISTGLGASVNVVLDYILLERVGMGVQGAAIATAISQTIAFLYIFKASKELRVKYGVFKSLKLKKKLLIPIILVGVSAFIIEVEDGLLMGVLSKLLFSSSGEQGVIILGVATKLYMFLYIAMFGMASAMQPIAAFTLGTGNFKRLKALMKKTLVFSLIITSVLWIGALFFANELISIFFKDELLIKEAARSFRIMISVFPVVSLYYVSIFYFQARGRARTSILIAVLRQLVIMLPVSLILVKGFGLGATGVWLSYPISDILAGIASFMLIRSEGEELNNEIVLQNVITKNNTQVESLSIN